MEFGLRFCRSNSFLYLYENLMRMIDELNFAGIAIGVATFFIIGLFHPLVIKGEYYFGVGCWWVFALVGVASVAASLLVDNMIVSVLLAVFGASSFWSIGELFAQRKRVEKGWFPKREKQKSGE